MAYDVFDYDSRHPKYSKNYDEAFLKILYMELDDAYGKCDDCDDEAWREHMLDVIIEFNNENALWFDPQKTLSDYEDWKRKQKKV